MFMSNFLGQSIQYSLKKKKKRKKKEWLVSLKGFNTNNKEVNSFSYRFGIHLEKRKKKFGTII